MNVDKLRDYGVEALAEVALGAGFSALGWTPATVAWLDLLASAVTTLALFAIAYTLFQVPYMAMPAEMTDDYHERTRLMGVQNFMGQLAYVVAPWFLLFMQNEAIFDDMVEGAAGLAYLGRPPASAFSGRDTRLTSSVRRALRDRTKNA